jgi:hypothetical protein
MAATLWIGTRKGAVARRPQGRRHRLRMRGLQFSGRLIHGAQDPRTPAKLLAAAKTGHLGPTVFREVGARVLRLAPHHFSEEDSRYAGGTCAGSFRCEHGAFLHSICIGRVSGSVDGGLNRAPLVLHPQHPSGLCQQDHCGICRLDRQQRHRKSPARSLLRGARFLMIDEREGIRLLLVNSNEPKTLRQSAQPRDIVPLNCAPGGG